MLPVCDVPTIEREREREREASLVDFPRGTRLRSTEHILLWHARDVAAASASGCSKPTNRTVILSHAVRFVARHGDHHPVSVTAHKTRRSWRDYRSQTESLAFVPIRYRVALCMPLSRELSHQTATLRVMNDTRSAWFPAASSSPLTWRCFDRFSMRRAKRVDCSSRVYKSGQISRE